MSLKKTNKISSQTLKWIRQKPTWKKTVERLSNRTSSRLCKCKSFHYLRVFIANFWKGNFWYRGGSAEDNLKSVKYYCDSRRTVYVEKSTCWSKLSPSPLSFLTELDFLLKQKLTKQKNFLADISKTHFFGFSKSLILPRFLFSLPLYSLSSLKHQTYSKNRTKRRYPKTLFNLNPNTKPIPLMTQPSVKSLAQMTQSTASDDKSLIGVWREKFSDKRRSLKNIKRKCNWIKLSSTSYFN